MKADCCHRYRYYVGAYGELRSNKMYVYHVYIALADIVPRFHSNPTYACNTSQRSKPYFLLCTNYTTCNTSCVSRTAVHIFCSSKQAFILALIVPRQINNES